MSATSQRAALLKELETARARSAKLAQRRAALPPGTSRARVTSINAKWARAAEHRDRLERRLLEMGGAQA